MIQVDAGLYIGSVTDLKDCEALIQAGITHILTVDSEEPTLSGLHTKFIHALDDPCTDLLSRLDGCVEFISEAVSSASSVLVHWWVTGRVNYKDIFISSFFTFFTFVPL